MQALVSKKWSFICSFFLLGGIFFSYNFQASVDVKDIPDLRLESLPYDLSQWEGGKSQDLSEKEQDILKLNSFIKRIYRKKTNKIVNENPLLKQTPGQEDKEINQNEVLSLYVGHWKKQTGDYQASKHSPSICLPSNGWNIIQSETHQVEIPGQKQPLTLRRLIAQKDQSYQIAYYWFFSGDKVYYEDWQALFNAGVNALFTGDSRGGIVEINTAAGHGNLNLQKIQRIQQGIDQFLKEFYPELSKLISEYNTLSKK